VESTTYRKALQNKALQDSHTAHCSPSLPVVAPLPGRTAHKLPVKISALIARFIVVHMVKEAKKRPEGRTGTSSESKRPTHATVINTRIGCKKACGSASNPFSIEEKRRLRVGRKGLFFSADTPKVRLRQTSNFQFRVLPLHIRWRGPKIKRDLLAPFQYLFLVYFSVEKLMHQQPNPIHFFF
jgi:hypothetical protein